MVIWVCGGCLGGGAGLGGMATRDDNLPVTTTGRTKLNTLFINSPAPYPYSAHQLKKILQVHENKCTCWFSKNRTLNNWIHKYLCTEPPICIIWNYRLPPNTNKPWPCIPRPLKHKVSSWNQVCIMINMEVIADFQLLMAAILDFRAAILETNMVDTFQQWKWFHQMPWHSKRGSCIWNCVFRTRDKHVMSYFPFGIQDGRHVTTLKMVSLDSLTLKTWG